MDARRQSAAGWLDHYQVRGWTGWHRFITLAVLTVLAAATAQQPNANPEIIGMTVAEIRRLLNAFVLATPLSPAHTLHWSIWRRISQPPPADPITGTGRRSDVGAVVRPLAAADEEVLGRAECMLRDELGPGQSGS